jgi:hypothetical protein
LAQGTVDFATSVHDARNLVFLVGRSNRLLEAEPLMRRALAIDEAKLRARPSQSRWRLQQPGSLAPAIQRLSDAEALSDRITEILFNIPPPATNILT